VKKSEIIVDNINLYLVCKILFTTTIRCDTIYFLLHRKNIICESFLIRLLNWKDIQVVYKKLLSLKTYKKHTNLADQYVDEILLNDLNIKRLDVFFRKSVGNYVFSSIYRTISIIAFIENDRSLSQVSNIYLYLDNKLNTPYEFKLKHLNFYSKHYSVDDVDLQKPYSNTKVSILSFIRNLTSTVYNVVNIKIKKWPILERIDGILILHPESNDKRYFSHNSLLSKINNYALLEGGSVLNTSESSMSIKKVPMNLIWSYLLHIYKGCDFIFHIRCIDVNNKLQLLKKWTNVFFYKNMIKNTRCSYIYSCYETPQSLLIQHCASDSRRCISMSSTFSFGYFPVKNEFSHQVKNVDVYFVWGAIHANLFKLSGDSSGNYITTGYIGSNFVPDFLSTSNRRYSHIKNKIITFYDTTIKNDLFLDRCNALLIANRLASIANNIHATLIIKTKKSNQMYAGVLLKYKSSVIVEDDPKGCLASSMKSDVVIGYLFSTPVLLSGIYGKKIIFIDPYKMIDKEMYRNLPGVNFVHSEMSLYGAIKIIFNTKYTDNFKNFDAFGDYESQSRIADYINFFSYNKFVDKNEMIRIASEKYAIKYGKRCVDS